MPVVSEVAEAVPSPALVNVGVKLPPKVALAGMLLMLTEPAALAIVIDLSGWEAL